MTACDSGSVEPVPLEDARAEYREILGPLQQAMLPEADVSWAAEGGETLWVDDGVCRWSPGDSVAAADLPEGDPAWEDSADAVDDVLTPLGFDPVGDAGRRHGAPAYGFDTSRADGSRLQLYSVPGSTVIRLSGVPVDPSECSGG